MGPGGGSSGSESGVESSESQLDTLNRPAEMMLAAPDGSHALGRTMPGNNPGPNPLEVTDNGLVNGQRVALAPAWARPTIPSRPIRPWWRHVGPATIDNPEDG